MAAHLALDQTATQDFMDKMARLAPKRAKGVELDFTMKYGAQTKYVTATFDTKRFRNGLELMHVTDVQFGHLACNVPKFIEYRDWILREPNRYVILGGDCVDAATAISKASPYENTDEPQAQVFNFCELAQPMAHRIIGNVGGNHERRSALTFGDLGRLIASILRIPYSAGKQFIDVRYGKHQAFKVSLWHGGTGSRTKGAKAQMLHRFMVQGESQLYLVGHLHDAMLLWDWRELRTPERTIFLEKFAGAMSSSFLDYWGTYAEVWGAAPSGCMMTRAILDPDGGWEITVR